MEKQISFEEGLVCTPYSDVCPDGQLSMMHDVEVHAGSVRPSMLLGSEVQLGGVLKFIHKTGDYTHYIYKDDETGNLDYKDKRTGNVGRVALAADIEGLKDIAATGHILTFLCNGKEMVYGIWDGQGYEFLGTMPDLNVTFALEGDEKMHEEKAEGRPYDFVASLRDKITNPDSNKSLYEYVNTCVGAFEKKYCNANNGGFVYPFFVRAAWKLYTGGYAKFTEPVLMIPNTKFPCVLLPNIYGKPWTNSDGEKYVLPATYLAVNKTRFDGEQADPNNFGTQQQDGSWEGYDVSTNEERGAYMEDAYGNVITDGQGQETKVPTGDEDDDEPVHFVDSSAYAIANVMKLQARIQNAIPEQWQKIIQGVEIMVSSPKKTFNPTYVSPDEQNGVDGTKLGVFNNSVFGKLNSKVDITHFRFLAKRNESGEINPQGKDNMQEDSDKHYINDLFYYPERVRLGFKTSQVSSPSYQRESTINHSFTAEILYYGQEDGGTWWYSGQRHWSGDHLNYPHKYQIGANFVSLQDIDKEQLEQNLDRGDFFHFKTIEANDIQAAQWMDLPMREGQYESLVTQVDRDYTDTWSKDIIFPKSLLEYNGRINLYNVKIRHWVASDPRYALEYVRESGVPVDVYIRISRNGTTKIIRIGKQLASSYYQKVYYLFVPNTEAVGYIIVCKDQSALNRYVELPLMKSNSLDGVYYFNKEGYELSFDNTLPIVNFGQLVSDYDDETRQNYIYTSETNNPFAYTSMGLNVVGSGDIMKLAAMTKPLSEGQMGTFPLIAFCDDGNYALSVIKSGDKAGLYDGVTPMRPDVCINADSILGMEEGIFFVSQRGLMILTQNDAVQLSAKLDGVYDDFGKPEPVTEAQEISSGELEEEQPSISTFIDSWQLENWQYWNAGEQTQVYLPGERHKTFNAESGKTYVMDIGILPLDINETLALTLKIKQGETVVATFNHTMTNQEGATIEWTPSQDYVGLEVYVEGTTVAVLSEIHREQLASVYLNVSRTIQEVINDNDDTWIDPDMVDDDDASFAELTPRQFMEKCWPVWDYSNQRLMLVRKGYDEAYVMKADDKTWSTIELPAKVRKVLNSYPFSYVQFENNKVVILDDDYNFNTESAQGQSGLIVTRPMKLDSLLLKRITEFALQGNYSGAQTITIYGSNDLKHWFAVGSTQRKRVCAMRGYYFKYWRVKVQTNLKENENISGLLLKYNVKSDGRVR